MGPPLIAHGVGDACECLRARLPAVFPRRCPVDHAPASVRIRSGFWPFQSIRLGELRKIAQIEAGCLEGRLAKPPWLDGLCGRLIVADAFLRMPVHDRIFDSDVGNVGIPAIREECRAFIQFVPHLLERAPSWRTVQPAHAAVAESGAGRMHDGHEVPAIVEHIPDVADNVTVATVIRWQQVAGPCVKAPIEEAAAHFAGGLATD